MGRAARYGRRRGGLRALDWGFRAPCKPAEGVTAMTKSHASPQAGSLRLDFAYDASGLRLHKRTPMGKPARPSAALDRDPPPNAVVLEFRHAQAAG